MGAYVILVCRECRKAEGCDVNVKCLSQRGESLEDFNKAQPSIVEANEEMKRHLGHKNVTLESDAHGQILACDFDFDKDEFIIEW